MIHKILCSINFYQKSAKVHARNWIWKQKTSEEFELFFKPLKKIIYETDVSMRRDMFQQKKS